MNIGDTYKFIVRIRHKNSQGSGVIYFPEDEKHDVILTAKHVVEDCTNNDLLLDKILLEDGSFANFQLKEMSDIKIELCEDADLACILFPRGELSVLIGTSSNLITLDRKYDFKNCHSIGYPKENDALKNIKSEFRTYSEDPSFVIESNIAQHENLQTLGLDSYDSVVGMSGGGLFYTDGSKIYWAGILFEFKDAYKDYHSISIAKVNNFLNVKGISEIPVTYASSLGINEDWIEKHLNSARDNLDERYTREIENFNVPETEYFRYLEVGLMFRMKLGEKYHQVLEDLRSSLFELRIDSFTEELFVYLEIFISKLKDSYHDSEWSIGKFNKETFPFQLLSEAIQVLEKWNDKIRNEQLRIYRESKVKENKELNLYVNEPLRNQLNKVRDSERTLKNFNAYLLGDHVNLTLDPKILITGKAGKGKSHLLGDLIMTRLEENKPSIFILGQQLGGSDNPRVQIINRLGLHGKCSFNNLINVLNQIGEYLDERFFFVVDALNEGNGKEFWINEIAGFIDEFRPYPNIALILSVRSTYIDDVLPENLRNGENLIQVEHNGFAGQELEAVRHFCKNFELNEPGIPLLAPEFSNPLFLLLLCKALKASRQTDFPKGANGISEVYRIHTKSISTQLNREFGFGLPSQSNIVEDGINHLLQLGSSYREYKLDQVENHFLEFKKCNGMHLLNGMLRENILTDDIAYLGADEPRVKVVRFSYERYANHAFVKSLLDVCGGDPKLLINNGGYLNLAATNKRYFDEGILNALAIQVPERFGIELHELMPQEWLDQFDLFHTTNEILQGIVIESLPWRTIESIDIDKITRFIDEYLGEHYINYELYRIILTLAPNDDHPLNANYLHNSLAPLSMSDRDSFWLEFIFEEFNNSKSSLSRLIDWILDYEEHIKMSRESRLLTCITLGWMLCSPYTPLRDAATIGIVKLLDDDLILSIDLLYKFSEVDDLYIQERLLAAIYGAVIRSNDIDPVHRIAKLVFDTIFNTSAPPIHLMLRDYARGIIEYAYHLDENIDLNMVLVRPPYGSCLPSELPSTDYVESKYKLKWVKKVEYFEEMRIRGNNEIFSSLVGALNDKNPIGYIIEQISTTNISTVANYKNLVEDSDEIIRELINKIIDTKRNILEIGLSIRRNGPQQFEFRQIISSKKYSKEERKEFIKEYRSNLKKDRNLLKDKKNLLDSLLKDFPLNKKEKPYEAKNILKSYLNCLNAKSSGYEHVQKSSDYMPWIVQRVFELGYDNEFHGDYDGPKLDRFHKADHHKFKGKSESIGKKYEKIAGQELLARLTDNYLLRQGWGNSTLYPYNLARFQLLTSDIDPSVIFYEVDEKKEYVLDNWGYSNWRSEGWLKEDDWPEIESLLEFVDEDGQMWLSLYRNKSFEEPSKVGDEKYHVDKQDITYNIRSLIVAKNEKEKIFNKLKSRYFSAVRDFPKPSSFSNVLNGEFYWSKLIKLKQDLSESQEQGRFEYYDLVKSNVHVPVHIYNLSEIDFQGGVKMIKPSKLLYDGLNIEYIDKFGYGCIGEEKIVYCPNEEESVIWVRKDKLRHFLDSSGLDIVLSISGEKRDIHYKENGSLGSIYRSYLLGTYWIDENGERKGGYHITDKYDERGK